MLSSRLHRQLMTRLRKDRKPTFLWQGLLILLPVAALALVGLSAITRDRAAVQQDARQRAQEILVQMSDGAGWRVAGQLAELDAIARNWFEHYRLGLAAWPGSESRRNWDASNKLSYETDLMAWRAACPELRPEDVFPTQLSFKANGDLESPLGYESPPQPPAWVSTLSADQRQVWVTLRQVAYSRNDAGETDALVEQFLATQPPRDAQANAQLIRLRSRLASQASAESVTNLLNFADRYGDAPSESGVPLAHLALAEALNRAGQQGFTESIWRWMEGEMLARPSVLIPRLLERVQSLTDTNAALSAAAQGLKTIWEAQERLRELADLIRDTGKLRGNTTANLWVENAQGRWLCLLNPVENVVSGSDAQGRAIQSTNRTTEVRIYPKLLIERVFAQAVRGSKISLPGYFAVSAELAGEPLNLGPAPAGSPSSKPGGEVLAEATGVLTQPSTMLRDPNKPGQPLKPAPEFESVLSQPGFVLRLALTDPGLLFVHQRQRQFLFGSMIGLSAFAALVGFIAARRAFRRQFHLSELKSNFVSSVSHELRAPLASVRLMAESLDRGKVSETTKQHEYFRFIVQECRRLSSLIENVLDFSRIEQGRKQYEFEPTDVVALTQQTVKLMETYAAERQVKLSLQLPDSRTAASLQPSVDGKAIQQALVNLIDNAIKHSSSGGSVMVGLEVRGGQRAEGGGQRAEDGGQRTEGGGQGARIGAKDAPCFWLFVEDHGGGIPLEEQQKIFERFYRPGSELRRQTQGVGIGLSIVKHIVEAHGGKVLVRSAPGQGSRFTIELPLLPATGCEI